MGRGKTAGARRTPQTPFTWRPHHSDGQCSWARFHVQLTSFLMVPWCLWEIIIGVKVTRARNNQYLKYGINQANQKDSWRTYSRGALHLWVVYLLEARLGTTKATSSGAVERSTDGAQRKRSEVFNGADYIYLGLTTSSLSLLHRVKWWSTRPFSGLVSQWALCARSSLK